MDKFKLGLKILFGSSERVYFGIWKRILIYKISLSSPKATGLKLNIGCGQGWSHAGWIGIDYKGAYPYRNNQRKTGFDLNWDVRGGLPFRNNSANAIFMSHILEHFTYQESIAVLKECHRVLEPNGKIRIVVPDLDLYTNKFVSGDAEFFKDVENAGGDWLGNITDSFLMTFYSAPVWNNTCHKYAYNFDNLSYRLQQCGFIKIERSGYMKSRWPEFNDKAFDSSNSKVPVFSLYVEATK